MQFIDYDSSRDLPNIVVDGSPNEGTALTLTHWPGIHHPEGLEADLSAQMAFLYAKTGQPMAADVVTNNHFDQDGLVAMYALVEPETSQLHEDLLIDVAAAGDFGTYRYRDAARASMAIARFGDPAGSPIAFELTGPYPEQCAVLYERLLREVLQIALHPGRFRELWAEEDEQLAASEAALARGAIKIEQLRALDLAIVDIAESEPQRSGHRFGMSEGYVGAHPMALNNATGCFRLFQVHGRHYTFTDRYESWVQYRSRRPKPRVDLRPLAQELTAADSSTEWTASSPSTLTPQLSSVEESNLDRETVLAMLIEHLTTAPAAWDPYTVS